MWNFLLVCSAIENYYKWIIYNNSLAALKIATIALKRAISFTDSFIDSYIHSTRFLTECQLCKTWALRCKDKNVTLALSIAYNLGKDTNVLENSNTILAQFHLKSTLLLGAPFWEFVATSGLGGTHHSALLAPCDECTGARRELSAHRALADCAFTVGQSGVVPTAGERAVSSGGQKEGFLWFGTPEKASWG